MNRKQLPGALKLPAFSFATRATPGSYSVYSQELETFIGYVTKGCDRSGHTWYLSDSIGPYLNVANTRKEAAEELLRQFKQFGLAGPKGENVYGSVSSAPTYNADSIPKAESKLTEAERFEATFNFTNLVGQRIKEIRFMDGSVARYGYEWLD